MQSRASMSRHRAALLSSSLAIFLLASPTLAEAQLELQPIPSVELTPPELADAGTHIDVGVGMLVSGLSIATEGAGLNFGVGGMIGLAGGGTLMGVGSLLLFSAIPTWIVGAVRDSLARAGSERAEVAGRWELAGVVVFCVSMAIAALGAGLVGTSFGQSSYNEAQMIAGSTMLASGFTAAMFIGTPMWAEGARF